MMRSALVGFDELRTQRARDPEALSRISTGLQRNLVLLEAWLALISEALGPGPADPAGDLDGGPRHAGGLNLNAIVRHLVTDWGWRARSEQMLAQVATIIRDGCGDLGPKTRAVCLGAGAGRIGWELRERCAEVVAIDLEVAFGATNALLASSDLVACDPLESNARAIADLCPEITLHRPAAPNVITCVADALRPPILRQHADLLLSSFFTDIVGFPQLLRVAHALLPRGGTLMHFGPLGYARYEPAEMWTVEESRHHLAENGFQIRREAWLDHEVWPNASMVTNRVSSWLVVATRT